MNDNPDMTGQMLTLSEEELAKTLDSALEQGLDTNILIMIYDIYILKIGFMELPL